MEQGRYYTWLVVILVLALVAGFLVTQSSLGPVQVFGATIDQWKFPVREGLDLQGGTAVLLEADVPVTQTVSAADMESVRGIIERRVNGFGLTEATVQLQGTRRLLVEMPGVENPEQKIQSIRTTAFLEWVDVGTQAPPAVGSRVRTDLASGGAVQPTAVLTPTVQPTSAAPAATPGVTSTATVSESLPFYHTVISGKDLDPTKIGIQASGGVQQVSFALNGDARQRFAEFTAAHNEGTLGTQYYMCIVLDKVVVSCPSIKSSIPDGQGVITLGTNSTRTEAENLAVQLRYGSLSVPLKVIENRTVGPTLGQDSVRKSIIAGIIGMLAVIIFMIAYYRLPGVLATLALLMYATVSFALFKVIPVTLTLPGIAGFVLSVGVAVDANILIFERMKEELRGGRRLDLAVEAGFARAWPSIRDSNISTLITCVILYVFGNAYGASIVKGFAATLALGVFVSLFTAITVTRTFLHLVLDRMDFGTQHWWFGV